MIAAESRLSITAVQNKVGQSEASVLAKNLEGEKKRWQVVPASMDRFHENCQRWQGQCWFSSWNSLLLCHAPLWWMAAVTMWPSPLMAHAWNAALLLRLHLQFFFFSPSVLNCSSGATGNTPASPDWTPLNLAWPEEHIGRRKCCVYMYVYEGFRNEGSHIHRFPTGGKVEAEVSFQIV